MGELSLNLPVVGEKDTTAEPKVGTALSEIQTQINGKIATVNLEAKAVTEAKLSTALAEKVTPTVSSVATEQERENVAYGTLTTPDQVTLVLPENGLIAVAYQALWQESSAGTARAALFVGANQVKIQSDDPGFAPQTTAAATNNSTAAVATPLFSFAAGLASIKGTTSAFSADVTTGQIVGYGLAQGSAKPVVEIGGFVVEPTTFMVAGIGGPFYIFAAAGTYNISVQFKSSAGSVKVKNRKLWAWIV